MDSALLGRRVAALTKTGVWATAVLLTAADLVDVPDGINAGDAETLVVNGLTAYRMPHRSAKVRTGTLVCHSIDVWAGSGKPDSAKCEAFRATTRTDLAQVFDLLRTGVLTAKIAARYPLSEVAAAMELSESSNRTTLGKILLVP